MTNLPLSNYGYFPDHAAPNIFSAIFPQIFELFKDQISPEQLANQIQAQYADYLQQLPQQAIIDETEPVTLKLWYQMTVQVEEGTPDVYAQLIKTFRARYPNVTIEREGILFEEMLQRAHPTTLEEQRPDILQAPPMYLSDYVNRGLVYDLTYPSVRYGWVWHIHAWALMYLNQRFAGHIYGLSQMRQYTGVYYNENIFNRYKIAIPRTFQEFEQVLATLKQRGVTPFMLGSASGIIVHIFYELMHTFAAREELQDLMLGKLGWNHPPFIQALEVLDRWVKAGYFNANYADLDYPASLHQFAQGTGAMYITGSWAHHVLVTYSEEPIDFFPFPRLAGQPPLIMASPLEAWVLPQPTNPDPLKLFWAERFLDHLLSIEAAQLFYEGGISLSLNVDTTEMNALPGQREMESVVYELRSQIEQLSAPIVPITELIRLLPIVGHLDRDRIQLIQATMMEQLHGAEVVIIDITGLSSVDEQVVQYLIHSAQVLKLVGSEAVIVGVHPEVAQTLVSLNMDLQGLRTFSDLQQGIEYALRKTNTMLGIQAQKKGRLP